MNAPRRSSSVRCGLLAMGIVGLLATGVGRSPVAMAADNNWVGGASNGLFSDNANWSSPPSWGFGNSLKFNANTNATSLTNDYGNWVDNNDIFWDSTFPAARTLQSTGNGISFKVRLENQSSFPQTVTMPLSGGKDNAGGIELNPVRGSLILSGTLYNDFNVDYTVYGSNTATVTNLTLNTALGPNATQANVDFTVAGGRNTAVQVNASQLWAGTTSVQSGSFTTGTGVTLASSAIVVAGGTVTTTSANTFADTASLTVNSGRLAIGGSDTVASLAGTGGGLVDLAAGATLTFGDSSSTSFAGGIQGTGNFTKVGTGTFTFTGLTTTHSGTTTVAAGQFTVGNGGGLGTRSAVVLSGGTLSLPGGEIGSLAGSSRFVSTDGVGVGSNNASTSYSGNMNIGGQLIKMGSGTLALSGSNRSTGLTQVNAGNLQVDGIFVSPSLIAYSGATLSGTGTITGTTTIFGVHSPGNSPGVQTFNAGLTYAAGSIISWELIANTTGSAGTDYDQISIPTSNLAFSGSTSLNLSFNAVGSTVNWADSFWNVNRSWLVLDLSSGVTTGFSNLSVGGSLLDSLGNTLNPTTRGSFGVARSGQDVVLNFTAVPEPGTVGIALSGLGLAGVLRYRRRRATGRR